MNEERFGIYLHLPFCRSKCLYCDFSSFAGQDLLFSPYLEALLKEIDSIDGRISGMVQADTLYFGGGTPGYLPEFYIESIMKAIRRNILLDEESEITIEVNPENRSLKKFFHYLNLGINRLSMGVQSFDDQTLSRLGRIHSSEDSLEAFQMARDVGFSNISIDMIVGLPGQTVSSFRKGIERIIELQPEHASLYILELYKETPLARSVQEGTVTIPHEEVIVELYEMASEILEKEGYIQYEISNFSLPDKKCRHNMKYWTDQPYIGFGSSAHSYIRGRRSSNVKDLKEYIRRMKDLGNAVEDVEPFQVRSRIFEAIFTGLRLRKGIDMSKLEKKYEMNIMEKYESEISFLIERGLLEREGQHIRLTRAGIILSNEVFSHFI